MRAEEYLIMAWLGLMAVAGEAQTRAKTVVGDAPPSLDFLEFLGGLVEVGDELLGPEDLEGMTLPGEGAPIPPMIGSDGEHERIKDDAGALRSSHGEEGR